MSSPIPESMRAIKINGTSARLVRVPVPRPPPTYLLAKVHSVAINPIDWKTITGSMAGLDSTAGCDLAGTVVSLPTGSSKTFRIGDRITAVTHGGNSSNSDDGSFAEYALVKADLAIKNPDSLSMEAAATLPLGISTVGQGLFQKGLGLQLPGNASTNVESVLIYGGSTATGSLSIQFAKLAGYHVLSTCSKRSESFVKSLGADVVYDHRDKQTGQQIRKDTNNELKMVWDCIGSPETTATCASALSSVDAGCRYATTNPAVTAIPGRPMVPATGVLMFTIFDAAFEKFGKHFPASKEDFRFACRFFGLTEKLLGEEKLRSHPESCEQDGLAGVLQGFKDLRNGKSSPTKLVYRVADTPDQVGQEVRL